MSRKTPTSKQPGVRTRLRAFLWLMPLGGVALSLSFPNDLLPGAAGDRPSFLIAWIALLPLAWAMQALPGRTRQRAAWLYGGGFALSTVAWARLFGYIPWFLLALAFIIIFFPLSLYLAERISPSRRLWPLAFALAFTGLEWVRGQGMFGFPWAELGSSQADGFTARIASVGGIQLITFLLLWVTGAAVQAARERRAAPRWMLPASLAALAVSLAAGLLQSRVAVARWEHGTNGLRVSVVQPNVLRGLTPADLRIQPSDAELRRRTDKLIELSLAAAAEKPPLPADYRRLIVWPESALRDSPYQRGVWNLCRETGSYLLLGSSGYTRVGRSLSGTGRYGMTNSAFLFDPAGGMVERYDKIHLVPFGEFVPFRELVARWYTVRADDLIPGAARETLRETGVPLGVGICFESTFPAISRRYARQGAGLLVFITNDAWFHRTAAGRQHFNHARFRALETGLPVARAASTGISGLIAPDGSVLDEIPTYREGARARDLPAGVPGTFYTAAGWLFGPACLILALALGVIGAIRARHRQ